MKYRNIPIASTTSVLVGLVGGAITLVSTLVSLAKGAYADANSSGTDLGAAIANMVTALAQGTSFLNFFWNNSPQFLVSNPFSLSNIYFLIIYALFFLSAAVLTYGFSLRNRLKYINQIVEDEKIRRAVRELGDLEGADLGKVDVSSSSLFDSFVKLFLIPLIVGVLVVVFGAYALNYLGLN